MTYKLTIRKEHDYFHVKVIGENSVENVNRYMEEVLQKCKDIDCTRLLVEEQLDGPRLDTFKVFEIAYEKSIQSRGLFKAIAYVDVNAEGDSMQFAETVAVNRGLPLRVFSTVAEAEKWLLEKN
jgi:hypothetical protein